MFKHLRTGSCHPSHNGSVPLLRCTNRDCGHQWSEHSQLAVDSDCPECGDPAKAVGVDDDLPSELAGREGGTVPRTAGGERGSS
jgi:hypothetical protein